MPKLGVNIDHVATLRQARREFEPDPIAAARICEEAGCHSIVAHLREDRRHIQDKDILALRRSVRTRFNMEMSIAPGIVDVALRAKPDQATFVPERRQEVTTEGGLDVVKHFDRIKKAANALGKRGIAVSLFIAAHPRQIEASQKAGVNMIELHTGTYALAKNKSAELKRLKEASRYAQTLGLIVNAGHGLDYKNTRAVANINGMEELNIGHSIISRAVTIGLHQAVKDMLKLAK